MELATVNAIDNPAQLCADATIHSTPLKWGNCVISTVDLEDTGWRRFSKADGFYISQEGIGQNRNEEDHTASDVRKKKAKKKKKLPSFINKEGAGCTAELQPSTAGGEASKGAAAAHSSSAPWQQGYDEPTGYFYYFNEDTQETQWEPPAEGFIPLPLYPDPSFQSAAEAPQEEGKAMSRESAFQEGSTKGMAAFVALLHASSATPAAICSLISAARSMFSAASRPSKGSKTKGGSAAQASVPEASSSDALFNKDGGAMPIGEGRVASRSGPSSGGEEVARDQGVECSSGRAVIADAEQGLVAREERAVLLRARSTGFMSAIPSPRGQHIRFGDEEGDEAEQSAKTSAGECGELPCAAQAGEQSADSGGNESLLVRSTGLMQSIPSPAGVHLRFEAEHNEGEHLAAEAGSMDWVPVHGGQATALMVEAADMEISPRGQAMDAVLEDIAQHTVELHDIAAAHDVAAGTMQLGQEAAAVAIQPLDRQPNEQAAGQTGPMAAATLLGVQSDEQETEASQDAAPLEVKLTAVRRELMQRFGGPGVFQRLKAANLSKYWMQRYSLWSRFDEGVLMDEEGWYSATPEVLARHHAERLACNVAVDAFCGVGGNAVQLASTCRRVIAVDISLERLQLAQHNAAVYGVADRIDFVCADFLKLAPHLRADTVFLSPPWGGPSYSVGSRGGSSFDIEHGLGSLGVGFNELLSIARSALVKPASHLGDSASSHQALWQSASGVACFLPRNSSLEQLSAAVPVGSFCEVERNFLNDKLKSVTVYCGQLANVA